MKIFITSDHHFYHSNIIKYCNRPFSSLEEMEEKMIEAWNSVVSPEDTVYHLGDFCFWKKISTYNVTLLLRRLNGTKILIKGNHDSYITWDSPEWKEFHKFYHILEYKGKRILLIHYPIWKEEFKNNRPKEDFDFCFFGHVHNNDEHLTPPLNHINVSVEVMNYMPLCLDDFLFGYNLGGLLEK